MKHTIHITAQDVLADPSIFITLIGGMEACIVDFPCFRNLPETLEFKMWGAILHLKRADFIHTETSFNLYPKALHHHNDYMYISGLARIRFTKIKGGKIEIYPYDPIGQNGQFHVIKTREGADLCLERTWSVDNTENLQEYIFENTMDWPNAACNLWLYSDGGTVDFEFDDLDLVSYSEFQDNWKEYALKGTCSNP